MSRRIGVVLPPVGVYPAVGSMLEKVLPELGWGVIVRFHANPDLLNCDVLLCAGLCRYIEGLPALLRARRNQKPVTLLWQLEPLPPVGISAAGETVGARVAQCDWGRIPLRPRRVLDWIVPFRTKLMRGLRRRLASAYAHEVASQPNQQGWKQFDTENFFNAMADWRWIQQAQQEGWIDFHFASNQARTNFLESRGIQAEMIPFGHHPDWSRDLGLTRDTDVLFLGSFGRGPRNESLHRLEAELARKGRTLTFVSKAYGAERDAVLSRARIMLNLLRVPHDLAGMRVLLGMGCGALVVSEQCDDTGGFRAGEHLVMAPREQLATVIEHYLNHEDERESIAKAGQRFVTQELTLRNSIHKMLSHIEPTTHK